MSEDQTRQRNLLKDKDPTGPYWQYVLLTAAVPAAGAKLILDLLIVRFVGSYYFLCYGYICRQLHRLRGSAAGTGKCDLDFIICYNLNEFKSSLSISYG